VPEKLSPAQQKAIAFMRGKSVKELGALGASLGQLLAELTAELADAKQEAAHWKKSAETIRDEILVLVAVCIRRLKIEDRRLLIGKQEYLEVVRGNVELYYAGDPEVRIYELRERRKRNPPVDQAVGGAINGKLVSPH
jgi:hypothetical protein